MTIDKNALIELIELGADVEFSYNGKMYTILAWIDDGISVGEQNSADDAIYFDCNDFIQNFMLDSVPILDALPQINILYHS